MDAARSEEKPLFVLIHSPLVGPLTWGPVAEVLGRADHPVIVPPLESNAAGPRPYWRQHVDAVARALASIPPDTPLTLAGHSGGGMLLPLIRQETRRPVSAYLFVDAVIPQDGKSRLDLFETPEAADEFRHAAVDGFLSMWTDEDLREVIPDDGLRRDFVRELRLFPLEVYEEPIPVFQGWPDAPVSYLRFGQNAAYDADAARARREGWPVSQLGGHHFHMLVEPETVARTLLQMASP